MMLKLPAGKSHKLTGAVPVATFGGVGGGANIRKLTTHLHRGQGTCLLGKYLKFESLKWHFLHLEGTFEQNIKVFNHIFNSVSYQFQ